MVARRKRQVTDADILQWVARRTELNVKESLEWAGYEFLRWSIARVKMAGGPTNTHRKWNVDGPPKLFLIDWVAQNFYGDVLHEKEAQCWAATKVIGWSNEEAAHILGRSTKAVRAAINRVGNVMDKELLARHQF